MGQIGQKEGLGVGMVAGAYMSNGPDGLWKKICTEVYTMGRGQMSQNRFYVGVHARGPDEPMGQMASGKLFIQRCTACIKNGFGQDRFYVGVDAKGPHVPMGQMAFEKKFYTEG